MRGIRITIALSLMAATIAAGTGCRTFINLFGLGQPLRMALVTDDAVNLINPFSPYDPLLAKLSDDIGRPVRLEPCFTFQAVAQLDSGWYKLAVATPAQFAQLKGVDNVSVLAMPAKCGKPAVYPALLIVRADGEIKSIDDLRGKRVAFGTSYDSRCHYAALALLAANGLQKSDLAGYELLDLPLWRHVGDAQRRAKLVLDGTVDAAFVDMTDWLHYPLSDERPDAPCQRKLATLARTEAVPDLLVLASPALDSQIAVKAAIFLQTVHTQHPDTLKPLGFDRFLDVDDKVVSICKSLLPMISREAAPAENERPAEPSTP